MNNYETLTIERHEYVAVLTLNRPQRLNALNTVAQTELPRACAELEADDQVRVLIITGTGRGFCAGADLSDTSANSTSPPTQTERLDELAWTGRLAHTIYTMTKPTIAVVNGVAAGAGMSIALACDIRIGSELSRFKTVFIERSLSPDTGMSYFLPRIVGYARAADLIFSSRMVEASEAERIGLLNRIVPAAELQQHALEYAQLIATWPPLALRSGKRVLQRNLDVDFDTALRNEITAIQFATRAATDVKEARASFIEKRPPKFTGT